MSVPMLSVANHLWQSTLFALAAWWLSRAMKSNRAAVRYGVWLAASVKFLVPFGLLVTAGSHLAQAPRPLESPSYYYVVEPVSRAFTPLALTTQSMAHPSPRVLPAVLFTVWLAGFFVAVVLWLRWLHRMKDIRRSGTPLSLGLPIPAISCPVRIEPGVFGVRKPVLLLPDGIRRCLSPAQFDAVVAHELCHVQRRDNLTGAIHMAVEALFWFFPVVWWIRAQLIQERERACDEEALRITKAPLSYAEGILKVCRFYLAAPGTCSCGITGSNLRKRIEEIMTNRSVHQLSAGRKIMLAAAAIASVIAPLVIGIAKAPAVRAQPSPDQRATFTAASITPSAVTGEGRTRATIAYSPSALTMRNVDLSECVEWAYGLRFYQVSAPDAAGARRFDIAAQPPSPVSVDQLRAMLRNLLAKQFQLQVHTETKVLPVYELVAAAGGPKLPVPLAGNSQSRVVESLPRVQDGGFVFHNSSVADFAERLSMLQGIDHPVVDRTGIQGTFDITLPAAAIVRHADTASLFSMIEERLGLRLVPVTAPIQILVIDRARIG